MDVRDFGFLTLIHPWSVLVRVHAQEGEVIHSLDSCGNNLVQGNSGLEMKIRCRNAAVGVVLHMDAAVAGDMATLGNDVDRDGEAHVLFSSAVGATDADDA